MTKEKYLPKQEISFFINFYLKLNETQNLYIWFKKYINREYFV